jgi:hypothetical protein
MGSRAELLIVDYENRIPKAFSSLFSNGYRVTVVQDNIEASMAVPETDLIIVLVSNKKREAVKLMEHVRGTHDPYINFLLITEGGDDKHFFDRVNPFTFQCFKKYRFGIPEFMKAIDKAIEMKELKVKEKRFIQDLNEIEEELKEVEHRLFTLSRLQVDISRRRPTTN